MMAKGHSTSTLCGAALVLTGGSALGLVSSIPPGVLLAGALYVMAGSLRPDIDHKDATATHVWSLLSVAECLMWRSLATGYYSRTRHPSEPETADPHRHLTHSPWVGCVLLALWEALWLSGAGARVLVWVYALWRPQAATYADQAARLGGCLALGLAAGLALAPWSWKGRWIGVLVGAGATYAAGPGFLTGPTIAFLAACVWFGCYCHCLGDCVTEGGAPLHHPFVVSREVAKVSGRGRKRSVTIETKQGRWVMIGPPRWMRFPTGGWREKGFLVLLVALTAYLMALAFLPGVPTPGPF